MDIHVIQDDKDDLALAGQAPEHENPAVLSAESGAGEEWDGAAQALAAGLPPRAILNQDGTVRLALSYPISVQVGEKPVQIYALFDFALLKGKHMRQLLACKPEDTLSQAVMNSTGLGLGRVKILLDEADAADVRAIGKVIGFLSGAGDRPGT